MSSKPKVTTNARGPLAGQQAQYENIWSKTGEALNASSPDEFYFGPTPTQLLAVDQMKDMAPNLGAAGASLSDMATKIASGYFLDPTNDPTFQNATNAAIAPITQQLTERVLPQISDASLRAGGTGSGPAAYGGARQDIQENQAVDAWTQQAGNITADMANKSRAMGMNLIPQAPGIAAGANTQMLAPAVTNATAGAQEQQWGQGALDALVKEYLFGFTGPQSAASILSSGGFGTQTQTGPAPDKATQWLQGLTGGAAGLNSLFGAQGMMPQVGAAMGTGLANLFPMFALSDRRMKENIVEIGRSHSGTPIYRFNYKGSAQIQLGMMADEVDPAAVERHDGLDYVNYLKATEKDVTHA